MNKTKIEWCDSTWNPVTGCLHNCEYCYAKKIANRFSGCDEPSTYCEHHQATWKRLNPESSIDKAIFEVYEKCPPIKIRFDKEKQVEVHTKAPYPWGFQPTMRFDRINEPTKLDKPRTIFVCSMADLFGKWIPDKWIMDVFNACEKAPQHRYLFLTKNPDRYVDLASKGVLPERENMWYGTTVVKPDKQFFFSDRHNTFVSIEPIQSSFCDNAKPNVKWVIVGAETGSRKEKIVPDKAWIDDIAKVCYERDIPLMMKDSLIPVVGEENMMREFPWEI